MARWITDFIKTAAYHTPLARFVGHTYQYNFTPEQLCFLCSCINKTADLPGAILEIGCFIGATSVWLNKHMDARGINKPYIAIDTFSGFTEANIGHEVGLRSKAESLYNGFSSNCKFWFDRNMELNSVTRVKSIEADASTFNYQEINEISFALIDVDLYLPTKHSLEQVYNLMPVGGIIVVDDCLPENIYDGALQAYEEFVSGRGFETQIVCTKLGVIMKGLE